MSKAISSAYNCVFQRFSGHKNDNALVIVDITEVGEDLASGDILCVFHRWLVYRSSTTYIS